MEQVLRIKTDLEASSIKKDSRKALELLRSLVNIPITMMVLQDTHIGMVVNKVRRQFDDPEIVSLGRSIMRKWKKMYDEYRGSRGDNNDSSLQQQPDSSNSISSSSDPNQALSESVSSTTDKQNDSNHKETTMNNKNPVASTSSSLGNTNGSKPKPSRAAPVQTEVPHTTSAVRLKFREMIVQALKTPLPKDLQNQEPFLDEEVLAARIEEHIYQDFKSESDMKYKNRVRSRIYNLKDNKNPYLRLNVLRGDIAPDRFAKMAAEEMASDELKREREKYTKEAINDHQMALTTGTRTSEIKCPACKKYDCTYNQMQTRSSDEPMTTFCYCNNCGKRWKFC